MTVFYSRLKNFFYILSLYGIRQTLSIYYSLFLINNQIGDNIRLYTFKEKFFIRPDNSDVAVFKQIFIDREYEVELPSEVNFILDAGANIGLASLYFHQKCPKAKIVALEPEKNNFELCIKNTKAYPQIEILNVGLWSHESNLVIKTDRLYKSWEFVFEEVPANTPNSTPCISVSQIMQKYNLKQIDIFKIDIESAEYEIFSNHYQEWLPYCKVIIVELHDWIKQGCSQVFFHAISNTLKDFKVVLSGENLIIYNNQLK